MEELSRWAKMTRSKRGKVLAWICGIVICMLLALCCCGVVAAARQDCYRTGVTSFGESDSGQMLADRAIRDYCNENAEQYREEDYCFRFTITSATGRILFDTADPDQDNAVGRYSFDTVQAGEVTVETYLRPSVAASGYYGWVYYRSLTFSVLYGLRWWLVAGVVLFTALGLFCLVFLFCGAGRKPGCQEAVLCGFDRIPAEAVLLGLLVLTWVFVNVLSLLLFYLQDSIDTGSWEMLRLILPGLVALVALYAALVVASLLSFARWVKAGRAFQGFLCIRALHALWRGLVYALRNAPLVWQAALAGGAVACLNLFAYFFFYLAGWDCYSVSAMSIIWLLGAVLWAALWVGCILAARNLQTLRQQAERMAAGDYRPLPDSGYMLPFFRRQSATLAHIGQGMNAAVEQRIKSERLKTELITNVSHDLKTPLTSIINYTDLIQKEPLPEKAAEYAEVLARQGEKLKKLTEDLIEASKASSGAMPCHAVPSDLQELCEQAAGEYAERLAAAGLTPVLALPAEGLRALADGRLTWRVLDNLLNNACKYAQPGTRLYITGTQEGQWAKLEVKNISREALNVSADELMERFVRGDSARNSEGSGLGLSIARSLTELQGGHFALTIDGDLFKAQLALPALPPAQKAALVQAETDRSPASEADAARMP